MTTILIAEDEPDIRQLVELTLTFGGFNVVTTMNGAEAVEKARIVHPNLILLDVRMPRMSGYEACAALKRDPATASIPVVFLSAKGQQNEVRSGLSCGALDYILKPFSPEHLIKRVRELIAQHPHPDTAPVAPAASGPADAPASKNGSQQHQPASS